MNNFNNVFQAIKKLAGNEGEVRSKDCFEQIAHEAGIPVAGLDFFLKTLRDLQLIHYSKTEHYVRLTPFGKQQRRLFSEH